MMTNTDMLIKVLNAEITQLRADRDGLIALAKYEAKEVLRLEADLAAERELADRLAETVRAADYVIKSARPDSGWLFAYKDDIAAANTRRNK